MSRTVGIDLGTTYSALAIVNEHGKPEIISNREGERITPSVVLFDGETPIVGTMAKRSAAASPQNVAQFAKRHMGEPSWRFYNDKGDAFTAEEISALVIKRLKDDAEAVLNEKIENAVITVPAYFNDAQRKATQDAGKIAGLNVLRIINEPTAAALSYGEDKSPKAETVLVYDLGGGTFDVTIMHVSDGKIDVKATGGNKNLGGFDWDNEVMNYLSEQFKTQTGMELAEDPAIEQDLRDKAEIAKKTLSSRDKATVFLSSGGKNASVSLTLETFNEVTEKLLSSTGTIMELVREDAKLEWSDIDKVLLVGGSTRMRGVAKLVESVTGKKPSIEVHPDEAVALGAALQAAILDQQKGTAGAAVQGIPFPEIQDVNSHSMGVVVLDEVSSRKMNSIILKKDTKIPCRVSQRYSTVAENQTEILVQVTQGESEEVEDVEILGETAMKIPRYPKGAPIEVFFAYDADGIVHLTVTDLTAKRNLGEMKISRTANLSDDDIKMMTKKVGQLEVT
jgi:molecular chaperone DnaK